MDIFKEIDTQENTEVSELLLVIITVLNSNTINIF